MLFQNAAVQRLHHKVYAVIFLIDIQLCQTILRCGKPHLRHQLHGNVFLHHGFIKIEIIETDLMAAKEILPLAETIALLNKFAKVDGKGEPVAAGVIGYGVLQRIVSLCLQSGIAKCFVANGDALCHDGGLICRILQEIIQIIFIHLDGDRLHVILEKIVVIDAVFGIPLYRFIYLIIRGRGIRQHAFRDPFICRAMLQSQRHGRSPGQQQGHRQHPCQKHPCHNPSHPSSFPSPIHIFSSSAWLPAPTVAQPICKVFSLLYNKDV